MIDLQLPPMYNFSTLTSDKMGEEHNVRRATGISSLLVVVSKIIVGLFGLITF